MGTIERTSMPGARPRGEASAASRRGRVRDAAGRAGVGAALGLAAACLAASCGEGGGAESLDLGRPPVVLILLDALHAEHLSHLGNERETTPVLDALSREGVSFTNAFAPAPYTLATISSILTGRLPDAHGLVDKRTVLEDAEVTLAEVLSRAGYRTCAAVGNLNGSSIFDCDQGFDEYVEVFRAEDGRSVDVVYGPDKYHFARAVDYPPLVERFLGGDDGRPLFMYLHILEPHEPYTPPEEFRTRWLSPAYHGPYQNGDSATLIQGRKGERPFTDADKEAVEALYDANLAHVDQVVGRIFEQLDAAGILDEALVIVTSDHGEAFWQHGEQGHNTTLYDEMLQVPLIVRFPKGVEAYAGARPEALVSPMDLVPSVAQWLNLPLPAADLDGVSLSTALEGTHDPARSLVLRSHHDEPWYALRSMEHKTIVVRQTEDRPPRVEHYRLGEDPAEGNNRRIDFVEQVQADVKQLQDFAAETAIGRAERGMPLSESEKAMLTNLGYTDD